MEFVLALVVAGAFLVGAWWRSGLPLTRFLFFGIIRFYVQFWHRWWAPTGNKLPAGPLIVISNHTSSSDPPSLQTACYPHVLSWLAWREPYDNSRMVRLIMDGVRCVPVARTGLDVVAVRGALRRLRDGYPLCLFPEGGLSGIGKGRLCVPKAGAAWLALKTGVPVVPAYITGGPQTSDLLPAWARPSRKAIRVYLGKPIDLSAYQGRPFTRKLVEEVSFYMMDQIRALAPKRPR